MLAWKPGDLRDVTIRSLHSFYVSMTTVLREVALFLFTSIVAELRLLLSVIISKPKLKKAVVVVD